MVELRGVEGVGRALLLRQVHRDVGALEEQVDVAAVARIAGDSDAGLDVEREPVDQERLVERRQDPLDSGLEAARALDEIGDEHPELVAAEPRDRVGVAKDRAEPARELDEQAVAVVVAEACR